ncbi:MAG: Ku protein [Candidatus Margulisiibacteriota bacterium]
MRSMWQGYLSFGLVTIPIKMYTATEHKALQFHYLHERCKTRLNYERYCPKCDAVVPWEETVRGYEYEKGKYVVLRDEDFELIPLKTTKTIDIIDFVSLEEIDPIYFDKAYYLEPEEAGVKAYNLLREAMLEAKKVALAKVVIREKEHLVALRVLKDVLLLNTMFYPDEILPTTSLVIPPKAKVEHRELTMALDLIKRLTEKFNPEKYTDQYRKELLALIKSKIKGVEVKPPKKEKIEVEELMKALHESIEWMKKKEQKVEARRHRPAHHA